MFDNKEVFKNEFIRRLLDKYSVTVEESHISERYDILGTMVRDYASRDWRNTKKKVLNEGKKQLIYFSMEFLIGRLLVNNLQNLGIYDVAKDGLAELGINIHELEEEESDAGLGNGGLGRLAACFLDSTASLGYPVQGNCIRYEYGFFKQKIVNDRQEEIPDQWLSKTNAWEVKKTKHAVEVKFYGHPQCYFDEKGEMRIRTVDPICVKAVPYDISVIGYRNQVVNTLRVWSAEASEEHLPKNENFSDYLTTLKELCHGLYPDDSTEKGKLLRLRQQYFLVSAGLQSYMREHLRTYGTLDNFSDKYNFQLNDTHPILAIPEMMRLLMDEYNYGWDEAWNQVTKAFAYTNHTVMVEALEKWPINYVQRLIPRCYMIIEEINRRFMSKLHELNISEDKKYSLAIIKDGMIHMTNLAIVSCYSVNGVAALHTQILKTSTFKDFYDLMPEKFNNKTNGITHRRWFLYANPKLASEVTKRIGDAWILNPDKLTDLMKFTHAETLKQRYYDIKLENKKILAQYIKEHNNIEVDINSIFDVQIKRLHAYKRQLLNVLQIIYRYFKLKNDPTYTMYPHTYIFGAKAAPSYKYAKKIIELINTIARVINSDESVNKYMKVVFIENYGVTLAEKIIPASDISEQISTAGKEASGTSNMKFMMNGAITLGTLDGANVEISERVGDENCVIFGLKDYEVNELRNSHSYNPWDCYNNDPNIHRILDSLIDGTWDKDENRFKMIFEELLYHNDEYFLLKDFPYYVEAARKIENLYLDKNTWAKMAIVNIAQSGYFSSDRTIKEYATEIWHLEKVNN